jgi:hypothetical protein
MNFIQQAFCFNMLYIFPLQGIRGLTILLLTFLVRKLRLKSAVANIQMLQPVAQVSFNAIKQIDICGVNYQMGGKRIFGST